MKKNRQIIVTSLVTGALMLVAADAEAQADWSLSGNVLTGSPITSTAVNERLGSTNNFDLVFQTNGTEKMRITSGGNIGIGTVGPAARFQVVGDILLQSGLQSLRFIPGTTSHQINSSLDLFISSSAAVNTTFATASTYKISSGTSGNVLTTVLGNGFMGIGITAPTSKFQVFGGQMSQVQSGTFGLFATGNEWMGFGLAGSASAPITSVYGMAISRGGFAGYHNLQTEQVHLQTKT
jgi:hypothetical protein